jgi:hypothetical protein
MAFMQMRGFTCGMEDLFLDDQANDYRKKHIDIAHQHGVKTVASFVGLDDYHVPETMELCNRS